jgi:YgaB-like protein
LYWWKNKVGGGGTVEEFNRLVTEQMKTMDKLLFLQSELERCQDIEMQIRKLEQENELESVHMELSEMKDELKKLQKVFEMQTEDVIRSYQEMKVTAG